MVAKPNFRSNAVNKVDLSSTLQRGSLNRPVEQSQPVLMPERASPPPPAFERPTIAPAPTEERAFAPRKQLDSRKKKLAHLKTLLEYEEKKEITNLLHEIGDIVGHGLQFSIFNRGLLLAALAQRDEFLRVAQKLQGIDRPSNGDVEAFREYEAKIGQMIFDAFDVRASAAKRKR